MTDTLDTALDRDRDVATLQENYVVFLEMCRRAESHARREDDAAAAVWTEVAALHACSSHCGILTAPPLERLIAAIGRRLPPAPARAGLDGRRDLAAGAHVLHVATAVGRIGGLSHFLWRWIEADPDRRHSVALTHQLNGPLPERLVSDIRRSGGALHLINRRVGSVLHWASDLRAKAAEADLVVLHVGNQDVVALLALADKERLPPVLYVNHADHAFWLGTAIADLVVNFREGGRQLCITRRGVEPRRAGLLPLLVDMPQEGTTRDDARRTLGLPEDAVVLLSVARGFKFAPWQGQTYAAAHASLLSRHPEAILVVVGAAGHHDWSREAAQAGGRILSFPERDDAELFFRAADIYVDSFPYCSITSLLEAGMHGLPLVSRLPFSRHSDIAGAQVPGIAGTLFQAESIGAYEERLDALIADRAVRERIGMATREGIRRIHTGAAWQRALESTYRAAHLIPRRLHLPSAPAVAPNFGEPDTLKAQLGRWEMDPNLLILCCLRLLPMGHRIRELARLAGEAGPRELFRPGVAKALVPEWLLVRCRGLRPAGAASAQPRPIPGIADDAGLHRKEAAANRP